MREIKFRAWCQPQDMVGHMVGWATVKLNIRQYLNEQTGKDTHKKEGGDSYTLMQYTGLKDKNGIEIYEGDLLKITTKYLNHCGAKTSDEYRAENYAFYEVFFHDNDACDSHIGFQMNRRQTIGADGELQINPKLKPSVVKNCEVIGNIYENPELLNTKE